MTVQKHIRFDNDMLKFIEDWRSIQRPIPTFNEAVNLIVNEYRLKMGLVVICREVEQK
jgi:hypothetical protein